jgi:hypothetical protein
LKLRFPGSIMSQRINVIVFALVVVAVCSRAKAEPLVVAGSPAYDSISGTGFQRANVPLPPASGVNSSGTAVGYAEMYNSGGNNGLRAVRWDGSGTAATELGNLGMDTVGYTECQTNAVNAAGTVVGFADKFVAGINKGQRAVRWDSGGTTATELDNLGLDPSGFTNAWALAVNDAGTAVGQSYKYASGGSLGERAVRWDASGTTATELGTLGTDSSGVTHAYADAVNGADTAVGSAESYVSGSNHGYRAVRWNGSGAAAELDSLGTDSSGSTFAQANAVNSAGSAVGYSRKYVAGSDADLGYRAVRWDASGTAATELGNLGTDISGSTFAAAYAVNSTGTAVGSAGKYVAGIDKGVRAVRWDASETAAAELSNLGTASDGTTSSIAWAVNSAGISVGFAEKYVASSDKGKRAVIWLPDASVIDLNDLGVVANPHDGTWLLTDARAISNNGWVAGIGEFTPTGGAPYARAWVAHISLAVPEPGTLHLAILAVIACGAVRVSSRHQIHC